MGMCLSRLYFEQGVPLTKEIKDQFRKNTGLELTITTTLNLISLPLNGKEALQKILDDEDRYNELKNSNSIEDIEQFKEKSERLNYLGNFKFYNHSFYEIEFHIENNAIELLYGRGCYYFPTALNKSLFELGGKFSDHNNDPIKGWYSSKKWKKIKHWDKYKWYNKPRK